MPTPFFGPITGIAGGRVLSVKDRRDPVSGIVTLTDFVPAGASGVTANVTVVDTVGAGFLTINPGGALALNAATINWYESGQVVNNGTNLTLDAQRQVRVLLNGLTGSTTHLVIDVTGYYL